MSPFCKGIIIIVSSATIGINSQAQQPVTLHQALDSMEAHYASLKVRQFYILEAKATEKTVRDARLPSLRLLEQVNVGSDNSLNGSYFTMGLIPSTSGGVRAANDWNAEINNFAVADFNWQVSNFGGYKAGEDLARSNTNIFQKGLEEERYQLQNVLINNYFELLRNYYLLRFRRNEITRIATVTQAIHAYVNNGLRPGVDSSTANAELSQARLSYIETLRQYSLVKSKLYLLTGIDTALIAPDTANNLLLQKMPVLQGDTALNNHPSLNLYQAIYENSKAREQYIHKNYGPSLWWLNSAWMRGSSIAYGDVYSKAITDGLSYSRYNYMTGLAITYDLFDRRRMRDKLTEQQFQSKASSEEYQLELSQLLAANQQAGINVSASLNKLQEIPFQLNAATQAYQQKLTLYNNGLATIVDLMSALDVLNRAEIEDVEAMDQYWRSLLQQAYVSNHVAQFISLLK